MTSTRSRSVLPTSKNPTGHCPNPECGEYVRFEVPKEWYHQNDTIWPSYASSTPRSSGSSGPVFTPPTPENSSPFKVRISLWSCPACEHTCVVFIRRREVRLPDENGKLVLNRFDKPVLIWPARRPRELEDAVPEKVRDLFAEGSVAEQAGALRAAAALYRATIEEICTDRGAQGGNLNQKIEDLKNHDVEVSIVDDLHEARFLGNWSLHEGLTFAADEVADVADLIVEATFVLYVQPEERRRMREARRARRTKSGTGV